jgi:hypothetical protein
MKMAHIDTRSSCEESLESAYCTAPFNAWALLVEILR